MTHSVESDTQKMPVGGRGRGYRVNTRQPLWLIMVATIY